MLGRSDIHSCTSGPGVKRNVGAFERSEDKIDRMVNAKLHSRRKVEKVQRKDLKSIQAASV